MSVTRCSALAAASSRRCLCLALRRFSMSMQTPCGSMACGPLWGGWRKRREHQVVPFVYAGAAIMSPSLFADAPSGEFSLTKMFDRANEQERLVGLRLDGGGLPVGTPHPGYRAVG